MLCNRLNRVLENDNSLVDGQEGFKENEILSDLHTGFISNLNTRKTETPTPSLNIDLEKDSDSVWINGLLYKPRHYQVNANLSEEPRGYH